MNPQELAQRYFATVRSRDLDAFVALFTEDASFIPPHGRELNGHAAIREHQAMTFAGSPPTPSPQSMILGDRSAAVEVEVRQPDGRVIYVANCFYFDAQGLIERLRVYRRDG